MRNSLSAGPPSADAGAGPTLPPSDRAGEAIVLESLTMRFGSILAVDDVSFVVRRGEFVSLLGPSGCGKTTILRIIGGFAVQTSGTVRVQDRTVDGLPPDKRPVNTVFQRYALFPHRSVGDNVGFALEVRGVRRAERLARVTEALELVSLRGMEGRPASQLSGGQAQRVALARALIARPKVLLLDEPLAALDLKLRKAMQTELRHIQEELGTTFLYVTHDQEEALTMSDRVVLMNAGRIVQEGRPQQVYDRPNSIFASRFIGDANLLDGEVVDGPRGSGVLVAAHDLVLKAEASAPDHAGAVVVSVRPERITLALEPLEGPENQFAGVVRKRHFVGNLVRYEIEVRPEVMLTAECGRAEDPGADIDDSIFASWAARHAVIVAPDR